MDELSGKSSPGTSKSVSNGQNSAANAVKVIKALNVKNTKLQSENKSLREQLSALQQKCNYMVNGESSTSLNGPVPPPNAVNQEIARLTNQNNFLKEQFEESGRNNADDILEKQEFEKVVAEYRKILVKKDEEIAALREGAEHGKLSEKVTKLNIMLERARAANRVFSEEIESLQKQINDTSTEESQSANVHAPSDDVHGACTPALNPQELPACHEQVDSYRALNIKMQSELNAAVTEQENCAVKLQAAEKQIYDLRSKLQALQGQVESLQAQPQNQEDDPLVQSQMKAFMEDFNMERQEKQALLEEKGRIAGENSKLKKQLSQLNTFLASNNPPVTRQQPQYAQNPYPAQTPVYPNQQELESQYTTSSYGTANPHHGPRPTSPPVYNRQPTFGPAIPGPPSVVDPVPQQQSVPQQTRRIGFTRDQRLPPPQQSINYSPLTPPVAVQYHNPNTVPDFAPRPRNAIPMQPNYSVSGVPSEFAHQDAYHQDIQEPRATTKPEQK